MMWTEWLNKEKFFTRSDNNWIICLLISNLLRFINFKILKTLEKHIYIIKFKAILKNF